MVSYWGCFLNKMSTVCGLNLALVCQEQWLGMNGSGCLVVKIITGHSRDMGLSSTWFQFFSVKIGIKRRGMHLCISHYNMINLGEPMMSHGECSSTKMSTVCTCYIDLVCQEQWLGMNGPSGLMVKAFTQHMRDVGLSTTWFHFFSVTTGVKRKKMHLCISV